jgi:maltose O-acetyltransferase
MSSRDFSKKQFGQHSTDPNKPMFQRMLDGELYIAKDAKCQKEMETTKKWMARFNVSIGLEPAERLALLKERIGTVADGVELFPPFFIDYGWNYGILDWVLPLS